MSTNTRAVVLFASALGVSILFLVRWRQKRELRRRHRRKSQGSLNIGGYLQQYMTVPFVPTDIIAYAASFPYLFFSHITGIFGCDFGGTLSKIVYFETKTAKNHDLKKEHGDTIEIPGRKSLRRNISLGQLDTPDHQVALDQLYSYMDSSRDTSGVSTRDDSLSFYSNILGGRLHFLHFETRNMASGIKMLSSTGITENIRTIGCTGGGAHKYAKEFEDQLDITFVQLDELGCLVRGMNFALTNVVGECYTYRNDSTSPVPVPDSASASVTEKSPKKIIDEPKTDEKKIVKKAIVEEKKIEINGEQKTPTPKKNDQNKEEHTPSDKMKTPQPQGWRRDVKEHTYKVTMPHEMFCTNELFPYLVVNIGSGVSILKVKSPGEFERVSGSSLGGGTYWGLCRLLTRCATYEEVLDIAETGDAGEIDMLVRDIYGGDYDGMNLSGSMVASSFGKLVMKESPREGVKEEDLAIALLMMITNNIGQVSYLNAQLHGCTKIFFVGSFLRHNPISCRRLAFAINFWSKGKMEALFLAHEGYFGALGTFLQSAFGKDVDKILCLNRPNGGQEQEGTALPYVSRTPKGGSKSNLLDSVGSSRGSSSNSIFINDNATISTKSTDEYENTNRMNKRGKGAYGLDNDFLKFLCSWRPKVFDVVDPDQQLSDRLAAGKSTSQVDSPLSPAMPSFEQFRKASGSLWERAQDLVPRQGTGAGAGVGGTPGSGMGVSPGVSEGLITPAGSGTGTGDSKGTGTGVWTGGSRGSEAGAGTEGSKGSMTGSGSGVGRDVSEVPRTPDTRGSGLDGMNRREVTSEGSRMQEVAHFSSSAHSEVKEKDKENESENGRGGVKGEEEAPVLLRTPLVTRGSTMTTPTTGADGIWTWTEVRSNNASACKSEASSDYAVGTDYGVPLIPILSGPSASTSASAAAGAAVQSVGSSSEGAVSRGRGRGRVSSSPVPPVCSALSSAHTAPATLEGVVDGDATFSLQGTALHGSFHRPMMISSDDCIVNNISLNNTSYHTLHSMNGSRKSNGSHRTDDANSSTKSVDCELSTKREKEIDEVKADTKNKVTRTSDLTAEIENISVKINGTDSLSGDGEDQKFENLPVLGSLYPLFKDVSENLVSPLPSSTPSPFSSPFSTSYECLEGEEKKL